MPARRGPVLAVPVDTRSATCFQRYDNRTPLLSITTGRPTLLVTLTLPEHLEAGHVDFARQLAAHAWAYAVEVERRFRGLPPLPDVPVPFALTAKAQALLGGGPERLDLAPLPGRLGVTA